MLRVILGVTGGIAAYKATGVIRLLTEAGHSVQVIPTANALRFIGAATLEALSHNSVDPDLYTDVADVKHVALGQSADLVIVAPATAAFIARFAAGIADDLLLNTLLVTRAQIVIAPAMHTEMWLHPSTQQNIQTLRSRGVLVIEPDSGRLTGDDTGFGRLPEADLIVATALSTVTSRSDWSGKHVLVTLGGTQEPIDPVRFLGNRSSGRQGLAFARAAAARGATVSVIAANVDSALLSGFSDQALVNTASELADAISTRLAKTDFLVMAAAVSDYRVSEPSQAKIKRDANHVFELELVANPDLLAGVTERIRLEGHSCKTLGFAAETTRDDSELAEYASRKLRDKGCDYVFANDVARHSVFGSETTAALLITSSGESTPLSGTKLDVAGQVLDAIAAV